MNGCRHTMDMPRASHHDRMILAASSCLWVDEPVGRELARYSRSSKKSSTSSPTLAASSNFDGRSCTHARPRLRLVSQSGCRWLSNILPMRRNRRYARHCVLLAMKWLGSLLAQRFEQVMAADQMFCSDNSRGSEVTAFETIGKMCVNVRCRFGLSNP